MQPNMWISNPNAIPTLEQVYAHFGADVESRMHWKWQQLLNTAGDKRWKFNMWAMQPPYVPAVCVGLVFGGAGRELAKFQVGAQDFGQQWWPCIIGGELHADLRAVLCEPLLDRGCKKPWLTHRSRLTFSSISDAYPPAGFCPGRPPSEFASTVIIEELSDDESEQDLHTDLWQNWRKLSISELHQFEVEMKDVKDGD